MPHPVRPFVVCLLAVALPMTAATWVAGRMMAHQGQSHARAQVPPPATLPVDQAMRNVNAMMANTGTLIRDLSARHARMPLDQRAPHEPLLRSIVGTHEQLRRLQQDLDSRVRVAAPHERQEVEEACRSVERMAAAFEAMTKHLSEAMTQAPR
jgi:hypothetical protein